MPEDPISEAELDAYMDGELELRRRLAVETYLAANPVAAAQFMADMQMRTALRLIASDLPPAPDAMTQASARLSARLGARPRRGLGLVIDGRTVKGLAAAALLALILIPARNVLASPPDFVGDAVEAYHTGLLRAAMVSQVETPRFDAGEVQRRTRIRMPRLPAHWVVTDAQIFPSDEGPALQLMVNTPDDEKMSIFAVRAPSEAPEEPKAVRHEGASVAYWREGDMSYALTGDGAPAEVDSVADDIAADPI